MTEQVVKDIVIHEVHKTPEATDKWTVTGRHIVLPSDCPLFDMIEQGPKAREMGHMGLVVEEFTPIFEQVQEAIRKENLNRMATEVINVANKGKVMEFKAGKRL